MIIVCLFLLFIPFCRAEYQYNLSICAIFQDEAPYLKEWIEFHKLMGVEHFYLYNHCSRDQYKDVLEPYILSGLVELQDRSTIAKDIKAFNHLQCQCYTEGLKRSRGVSRWVAFLDIDEYLFPVQAESLSEELKHYETFGGLCVNWRIFGTSHVWQIPNHQLLIESLTCCTAKLFPRNKFVKSIVRPECASHFLNPHHPVYVADYFQVNTDKLPFEGMFSLYIQTNRLCINHYWTRDGCYFYRKKIPREKSWGVVINPQEIIPLVNAEKDETILRFLPALKNVMDH